MDFASSTRAAENRTRWKGIHLFHQIHLWCPDNLPRLWDKTKENRIEMEVNALI